MLCVLKTISLIAAILVGWTVFGLIVGLIVGPFLRGPNDDQTNNTTD